MATVDDWLDAAASRLAATSCLVVAWPLLPEGAHLVGGCVRDALLGRPLHDLDLVVPESAARVARTLARHLGGTHVVLDEGFDSHRVVLDTGIDIDIIRQQGTTLADDLGRRDLTVNAVAFRWSTSTVGEGCAWVDPCGGLPDLRSGILRAPAPTNWRADPLRLLRFYRIGAELGFDLPEVTRAEVRPLADLLIGVPGERAWLEVQRLVAASDPAPYWHAMAGDGVLTGLGWPPAGHVWRPSVRDLLPEARIRVQAVTDEEGADRLAARLRWSRNERRGLQALVRASGVWRSWPEAASGTTKARWCYRLREALLPLGLESARELHALQDRDDVLAACEAELALPSLLQNQPPLLRGDQVVARSGRSAGPWLGNLLQALAEEQAVGTLMDADGAWSWVQDRLSGASPEGAA